MNERHRTRMHLQRVLAAGGLPWSPRTIWNVASARPQSLPWLVRHGPGRPAEVDLQLAARLLRDRWPRKADVLLALMQEPEEDAAMTEL
jgi:hypothetical protein